MRKLLFIGILAILAACSTGADPEPSFQPVRIGSWMVTGPKTAQWIGAVEKAKTQPTAIRADSAGADTVIFNTPDGQSIALIAERIVKINGWPRGMFTIKYTDETIIQQVPWQEINTDIWHDIDTDDPLAEWNPVNLLNYGVVPSNRTSPNHLFVVKRIHSDVSPERLTMNIEFVYSCKVFLEDLTFLTIDFIRNDLSPITTYRFPTEGFVPALRSMLSCQREGKYAPCTYTNKYGTSWGVCLADGTQLWP